MEKKRISKVLNGLFLALVFGVTLWTVFHGEDFGQVIDLIQTIDGWFIVPSIACVILFILGESVVIYYLLVTLGNKVNFWHCCLYSFVGFFYSCVTPSASGGQPMQVVMMRRDSLPAAVSSVVLAIVTITYKSVLVLIGVIVLLVRPAGIIEYLEPVESLMYLGLALNVICIALLLLLVFHPGVIRVIMRHVFALMNRIRPAKNASKREERLERIISQYHGAADYYRSHKHVIVHVLLITTVQRFILFFVTWIVYRAFDLTDKGIPVIVSLQAMISVASDMLPLPGGMGVSENLFLEIFQPIFGEELVLPGMILCRGISYYTQLVISAVMTLAATLFIKALKEGKSSARI